MHIALFNITNPSFSSPKFSWHCLHYYSWLVKSFSWLTSFLWLQVINIDDDEHGIFIATCLFIIFYNTSNWTLFFIFFLLYMGLWADCIDFYNSTEEFKLPHGLHLLYQAYSNPSGSCWWLITSSS